MLIIFLSQAFHCTQVSTLKLQFANRRITLPSGFVQPQLEGPCLPQREGDDGAIPLSSLKNILVIRVPSNRHAPVLVQVEVATIGPLVFGVEATEGHAQLHELSHPAWKWDRLDGYTTVFVGAFALARHHPSCLPLDWLSSLWANGLIPFRPLCNPTAELFENVLRETRPHEACEATSGLVIQIILPLMRDETRPSAGKYFAKQFELQALAAFLQGWPR